MPFYLSNGTILLPTFTEGGYDYYYIDTVTETTRVDTPAMQGYLTYAVNQYWRYPEGYTIGGVQVNRYSLVMYSIYPGGYNEQSVAPYTNFAAIAYKDGDQIPLANITNIAWDYATGLYGGYFNYTTTVAGVSYSYQYTVWASSPDASEWTVGVPPSEAFSSPPVSCQLWALPNRWVAISSPEGAWYADTAGHASFFAQRQGVSIFRSPNLGASWAPVRGYDTTLACAEYVSASVLAVLRMDNGLWISMDDGASLIPTGITVPGLTFVEAQNSIPWLPAPQIVPFEDGKFFAVVTQIESNGAFSPVASLYALNGDTVASAGETVLPFQPSGVGYFTGTGTLCTQSSNSAAPCLLTETLELSSLTGTSYPPPLSRSATNGGFQKNPYSIEGV